MDKENKAEIVKRIYDSRFHQLLQKEEDKTTTSTGNPLSIVMEQEKNTTIHPVHDHHHSDDEELWIFGYGSLIWKVDFPTAGARRGYISGYLRRFYQQSVDHRGTPSKPGRVVTLVTTASPQDRVYGVAYYIAPEDREGVLQHLDYREKNGYCRCTRPFHLYPEESDESRDSNYSSGNVQVLFYIATPENESWAGDQEAMNTSTIAQQIFTSAGPSGSNREYLFNLQKSMTLLFPDIRDEHLLEVVEKVQHLIDHRELTLLEQALKKALSRILDKYSSSSSSSSLLDKYSSSSSSSLSMNNEENAMKKAIDELYSFCSDDNNHWREYFLTQELSL